LFIHKCNCLLNFKRLVTFLESKIILQLCCSPTTLYAIPQPAAGWRVAPNRRAPAHSPFLEASRPPDVATSLRGKRRGGAWPGNPLLPIPGAGAQHGGLGGDRRARIQRTNRGIPITRLVERAGI